jgi:hypothetical protein
LLFKKLRDTPFKKKPYQFQMWPTPPPPPPKFVHINQIIYFNRDYIFHCIYKIIIIILVKNEEAQSIHYYVTALDKDGNKLSAGELVKQRYYHAFILIETTQYAYILSKVQTGIEIFRLEQGWYAKRSQAVRRESEIYLRKKY